ncbi:MAG: IS630 family transposase [Terriglobales bacterium]
MTDAELTELKRMTRQEIGRVSQRAQMILLSAHRRTVPEIATIFRVSRATVRFWIRQFETAGPAGLSDDPRSGRPRKVTSDAEATLLHLLERDPQQVDARYLATFWTTAMLVLLLATQLQLHVCRNTIRNVLQRLRLRWRRPRLAMPRKTDPDKARKQWEIAEAVISAGPDAAVVYADESRVQTLPLLRAMWQWVGQQIHIPTPGSNTTRALFGALNIRTGAWHYQVRRRMKKEDFIAFLEELLTVYPLQMIILIVDNYSSHTAHDVADWVGAHRQLQLHFLPKYCSHLNPVEPIWLQMKGQIAANRLYGSIKLVLAAVDRFFARMTPAQALTWAGADK